jgi:ankyrin repeat protein
MRRSVVTAAVFSLCLSVAFALTFAVPRAQSSRPKVDFVRDVQPIFQQYCIGCHGPTQQMNGLRLDRRRDAMRGGTFPIIGPGNGAASQLYLRVAGNRYGQQMPPTGVLAPEQIAIIKAWIDEGADWPDAVANDAPVAPPDPGALRMNETLRRGDRAAFTAILAESPASAKRIGAHGITPLMTATLYGDVITMQALLALGADVNAANEAGATALMWAVSDLAKTQLLIDRGADVDARSRDGRTALMIASGLQQSHAVVTLLLDKGANPSASGPSLFGVTNPLTEAASTGDERLFRLLVDRGAELAHAGPGAIAIATMSGCDACAEMVLKASPPPFLSIVAGILAPPLGPARQTRMFIERGADVDARDPDGRPLIVAVAGSDALPVDTMQALLQRGADVHAQGPDGETAVDMALRRGQTPIVDLLMKAGAKPALTVSDAPRPTPAPSPRAAVTRSLPLLQRTDEAFLRKSGCVSCHNNSLTALTVATARQRGLAVDAPMAKQSVARIATFIESWRDRALQNIGIPGDADTVSYILLGLAAEHHPPDTATDALAHFLKVKQLPDGHWAILAHRPPIESSDIEVTAASMRALQTYAPRTQRAAYDDAIERAATWLKSAKPQSAEDRAFHLLGLHWARADRRLVQAAARAIVTDQRPDGGWAQIPTLDSDAYATGQALAALAETGAVRLGDRAFQRGVQFLLRTQLADGSWFVRTRAIPIQPQFDASFPHGKDGWISAAATNWAARALAYVATRTN